MTTIRQPPPAPPEAAPPTNHAPLVRLATLLLALLCCHQTANAQLIDHLPGRLIVALGEDVDARKWASEQAEVSTLQPLGHAKNIWLLRFDHATVNENEFRKKLAYQPAVVATQWDRPVTPRRQPNDTRYAELWRFNNVGQYNNGTPGADLNIEPAWDVTTGGMTVNGDEIVVAVLDDGTDLDHEDLTDNIWINPGEIPNNGVDDDNNGYVDDYNGFDTSQDDGDPNAGPLNGHGTPVAGIIGAVGNNGLGVTGVNWDVEIMTVRNAFLNSESEVLQAYLYVLEQRQRYDATGGTEGAYVVATNASWGRAFGDVNDSPIWCGLYDDLGAAGILNIGATANADIDVERKGDLPTNCPSEYLIGVTNLDTNGEKVPRAAFGNASIDLGAHGQEVLTTALGNGYRRFSGTSSATPHVTGAAALLYSAPCAAFGELLEADPAAAALYVRKILLETAKRNASLVSKTVTGGQLDVGAAMDRLMRDCGRCFAPTGFVVNPVPGSATALVVDYNAIARISEVTLRYRALGATEWVTLVDPDLPFTIDGLGACVAYEFELDAACGATGLPAQTLTTSTDGCCAIPEDFAVRADPNEIFTATWTEQLVGTLYNVRYRKVGTSSWTTRSTSSGLLGIAGGLESCTPYEFEFRTNCGEERTGFGSRTTVTSRGCGACVEDAYCTPNGYNNAEEWIAEVDFAGGTVNATGADRDGYGDYTGAEITMVPGGVYPITITPGNAEGTTTEAFRVYVDWAQDGTLNSNEVVADLTSRNGDPVTFDLVVPEDAATLSTRMRIVMNFIRVAGSACTSGRTGEYEDYCLDVRSAAGCPAPEKLSADFNSATGSTLLSWSASLAPGGDYRVRYRPEGNDEEWVSEDVTGIQLEVPDLNLCGSYEVELSSRCNDEGEVKVFRFSSTCVSTDQVEVPPAAWSISPNPAADRFSVLLDADLRPEGLRLLDVAGRVVRSVTGGSISTGIDVGHLPAGLYFVELTTTGGRRGVKRLVVQ